MWKFSQLGPVGVPQSKAVIALWARMEQLSTAPQYDAVTTITIIPRVLKLSIHLLPSNTTTKHIFKDWTNTRLLYIWAHLLSLLQNVLPERFNYPGMHGCLLFARVLHFYPRTKHLQRKLTWHLHGGSSIRGASLCFTWRCSRIHCTPNLFSVYKVHSGWNCWTPF